MRHNTLCNTGNGPRFAVNWLFALAGLALVLQNPQAQESAAALTAQLDLPSVEQVVQFRPQNPPPGVEGDQASADEGPEFQPAPQSTRETVTTRNLRERPTR